MSKQTFDEFVKKQVDQAKANQATNEIDWNKTREDWLRELCDLYSRMEKYLKKYTDKDQIRIRRAKVHLSEDHLGTYEAETLTFLIGNEKVVAKPIGTLLIGAWGRVDLVGARGSLRIVLLEKGGPTIRTRIEIGGKPEEDVGRSMLPGSVVDKRGWYIATLPPNVTTTALSADAFRDAIMELADV